MTETLLAVVAILVARTSVQCQRIREACADRPWSSQSRTDANARLRIVDAILGSDVAFLCRYCGERDKGEARFWYTSLRYSGGDTKEVKLGMADPVESNRMYMTSDRSLVIRNLTSADVSRYSCSGLGGNTEVGFALDLLAPEPVLTVSADSMTDWTRYEFQYLTPVEKKFPDQVRQMGVDWDTWGPCDGCAGKRYRRAACRVRFDDGTRTACRSILMPAIVSPVLATILSSIPDFVLAETCYAYCQKSSKYHSLPKYRNTFVLEEGSSLTLVCAEATAGGKVTWRKDGLLLTDSDDDDDKSSGVELDTFGTLYLVELTVSNSGNYTCYINGNRTQEVLVVVRKSSVLGSAAYIRHLYYLYYVLALYFVIFGARIFYAYLNRHDFVKITDDDVLVPEMPTPYLGKNVRIR